MDFVKMLLAMAASHLGGLFLCALYAGGHFSRTVHLCQHSFNKTLDPPPSPFTKFNQLYNKLYRNDAVLGVGTFLSMEGPAEQERLITISHSTKVLLYH